MSAASAGPAPEPLDSRRSGRPWREAAAALVLVAATVFAFWPSLGNGFVNYDDREYVVDNPDVLRGLDLDGVRWAFSTFHASNWHPLTWLSHMLDVSLFGTAAAGHHASSLVLHAGATLALFAFLRLATRERAASAAVALLFAVHPCRVESVAWVAERKDVLSTLLAFLALTAWTWHLRRPSEWRYGAAAGLFALGLLAKPMLVTLPLLLLLLDFWPYRRLSGSVRDRLLEKAPLLLLSAISAAVTLAAQQGARGVLGGLPLPTRAANAALATVQYVRQLAWPAQLSVIYPHPLHVSAAPAAAAAAGVALATLVAWRWRDRRPWLLVGWLWFLLGLVPVIGLVQVGLQARADRYTYLPSVGLLIACAWSAAEWARPSRARSVLAGAALGLAALAAAARTRAELPYWRDSVALFARALEVTGPANPMAQYGLGHALAASSRVEEAIPHFAAAVRLRPDFERALEGGADALLRAGRLDEAAAWYERLLQRQPLRAAALYNLAQLRITQGDLPDATRRLRAAAAVDPAVGRVRHDLGIALVLSGDDAAGAEWLRQAAREPGAPVEWRARWEEACARRDGRPAPGLARYLVESRLVLAEGSLHRGRAGEASEQLRLAAREADADQLDRIRQLQQLAARPQAPARSGPAAGARS